MNANIEINGKSLSGNPLLYIFYREATGRDLASDQVRAAKTAKKFECIKSVIASKNESAMLEELTEDTLKALDDFSVNQFLINLYFAGRCASEGTLLPYVEEILQMPCELLEDNRMVEKLFSILNIKQNSSGSSSKKK